MTVIYFVRHAHSVYTSDEYGRGLSNKGVEDTEKLTELFNGKEIDHVFSSPYVRAIDTVKGIADERGLAVRTIEGLKERRLAEEPVDDFRAVINKLWTNPSFAFPGGESNKAAKERGSAVINNLLKQYKEEHLVIGTHGNIMVLMMNEFDSTYDFQFWKQTTMPDVYKLTFEQEKLVDVHRMWSTEMNK